MHVQMRHLSLFLVPILFFKNHDLLRFTPSYNVTSPSPLSPPSVVPPATRDVPRHFPTTLISSLSISAVSPSSFASRLPPVLFSSFVALARRV